MKELLKHFIPHNWRPYIKRLFWFGFSHHCKVCNAHVRHLLPEGYNFQVLLDLDVVGGEHLSGRTCPVCYANMRTRLVWFYLSSECKFNERTKLLHLAPEMGIYWNLSASKTVDYIVGDINPNRYPWALGICRVDITDMHSYPDASFDVILANHILEHVPDDKRALSEILRVLRPGGCAILQVPISMRNEHTLEDLAITTPREREQTYGQFDHLRLYGHQDFPCLLERVGFNVTFYNAFDRYEKNELTSWLLNPRETIFVATRPLD